MKNKLTRLGVILLTTGLSFMVLTAVRGGLTSGSRIIFPLSPDTKTIARVFWVPRDVKLTIDSQIGVNINISDPAGTIIYYVENVTTCSHTMPLQKRGTYTISISNPSSSYVSVTLDTTFYNFERDLIGTFIVFLITGTALIITQRVYHNFSQQRKRTKNENYVGHYLTVGTERG